MLSRLQPSSHCTAHCLKKAGLLSQLTVNLLLVKSMTIATCRLAWIPAHTSWIYQHTILSIRVVTSVSESNLSAVDGYAVQLTLESVKSTTHTSVTDLSQLSLNHKVTNQSKYKTTSYQLSLNQSQSPIPTSLSTRPGRPHLIQDSKSTYISPAHNQRSQCNY